MKFFDFSLFSIYENGRKLSVFSLATPIFFEMASTGLLSMVNTLLLSGYSQEAIGATGVVGQLTNLLSMILLITTWGLKVIIGVELGKGNIKGAKAVSGTAFWMTLASSVALGILTAAFAAPLLDLMNLDGNPKLIAISFMKITCVFFFVTVVKSYFTVSLTCNGYSKYAMVSVIITQVLNIILGWFVLYSGIKFPITPVDALAVRGIISVLVGLMVAVFFFVKKKCPFSFAFDLEYAKRILNIGVPASVNGIGWHLGQTVTTSIIASFGIDMVNAKIYVSNIVNYVTYFSGALSNAVAVIMGRLRGRCEFEKENRLFYESIKFAMSVNLIVSLIVFVARKPLLSMFTTSSTIISLATTVMFVDVFVEFIRGATNICDQSLTANGDVKAVSVIALTACLGVVIFFAWLLGVKLGMGLLGCWLAFLLEELYKSSLYILRWRTGKWKSQKI